MTPERIAGYVFATIPDAGLMIDLDLFIDHAEGNKPRIRFEWKNCIFRITETLFVDEEIDGKLQQTAASILMTELFKKNITA